MKIFLSWSGERSHSIAKALRDWLPNVIQALEPWLSSSDIQVGTRWAYELELQLKETRVGIICLTPENLAAPWLSYEAGALSNTLGAAYVCPYLFGFSPAELHGPLVQFQATTANKEGTRSLTYTLNRALGENSIPEQRLDRSFDLWWPELDAKLKAIDAKAVEDKESTETKPVSPTHPITEVNKASSDKEIVELLQNLIRGLSGTSIETPTVEQPPKERIFIVHGHNQVIKESVARYIEKLGPAVIILHEQPDEGRTIIEKFESLSDVDYAVVLLTADDRGGPRSPTEGASLDARARQNVIFELGFFTAKLGRSRVSVLHEEGVEIPSDFSGILYIPIDKAGFWKFKLAQELKTAGLRIDVNNAL